jgi:hypothetical protein
VSDLYGVRDAACPVSTKGAPSRRARGAGRRYVPWFLDNFRALVPREYAAAVREGRVQVPRHPARDPPLFPPPSYKVDTPRPSARTNRTRRVPHPVRCLIDSVLIACDSGVAMS